MFIKFIEASIYFITKKYEIDKIYIIDKSIVVYNDNSYIPLIELYYLKNQKIWFENLHELNILYNNFFNNKINYDEIKQYK